MNALAYPTSAFDYVLPPELVARYPSPQRDESRLLVLDRASGRVAHHRFRDLVELVRPGDVIVLNETRVLRARLLGIRLPGGGHAEVLLLRPLDGEAAGSDAREWEAMVRPGARLRQGRRIRVGDELLVTVLESLPDGLRRVRLETSLAPADAIRRYGHMPLPPYIDRADEALDAERYQTVYARTEGSVAAPTAGLHFTPALLERLEAQGVRLARILLHVGVGTFRPVEVEDPARHPMHEEWYQVPSCAAECINGARAAGGAVWAVGTTVTRTLESVASEGGAIVPGSGWTRLFIRPGYRFRAVDHLLTNFHLPRSTLLMLVTALGGYERVMSAYREAVAERYRFYSYGDAMAVL
ncbi:MAG: tRNA preQ1(34) S-adenosylmethionine ribosyltransferase-isomerase QueA [Gemmatimonadetes bacterium]|nr:tRNA preQ1(34) S-adenosylmethionine ribosyltransferase-isomerase QueA [Gemmatimonadota bacterium]